MQHAREQSLKRIREFLDHDVCLGFGGFDNEQIKRAFPQLFKPDDQITPW